MRALYLPQDKLAEIVKITGTESGSAAYRVCRPLGLHLVVLFCLLLWRLLFSFVWFLLNYVHTCIRCLMKIMTNLIKTSYQKLKLNTITYESCDK